VDPKAQMEVIDW